MMTEQKKVLSQDYESFLKSVKVGISEVAEITNVPVRKLRYWQEKGIIQPVDPDSKVRQFDLQNIKKILLIQELIDDGYSLDGAAAKVEVRFQKISDLLELISIS